MSVILVGGRRYAANLRWLERAGRRGTARTAERLRRHWFVHDGEHTGFAGRDASGCPNGLPALSLALLTLIGNGRWVALVEGAAMGGATLYALVKARDGAVLADGEDVFSDRAAALRAFERSPGWVLHATPGLVGALRDGESEIADLDPDAIAEAASRAGDAIVLAQPSSDRGVGWRKLRVVAVALLASIGVWTLAVAGWAWVERDALLEWIAEPGGTPMPSEAPVPPFDSLDRRNC